MLEKITVTLEKITVLIVFLFSLGTMVFTALIVGVFYAEAGSASLILTGPPAFVSMCVAFEICGDSFSTLIKLNQPQTRA